MHDILALALHGMRADMARLDQVAANLANAATPGYKRTVAWAPAFGQRVEEGAAPVAHTDQRQGTLQATRQPLDLALSGPGWFEVLTEHGPAYTRQGSFRPDASGRLVTVQGHPVMGTAGAIQLPPGTPVVDAQGRIFAGGVADGAFARGPGEAVAQLRVVQFDDATALERLGGGLVQVRDGAVQPPDPRTEVRQGYLENSNVSSMHEMVLLLQALRHFESMQKVALGYDDMLGGAIRRLGDTT